MRRNWTDCALKSSSFKIEVLLHFVIKSSKLARKTVSRDSVP